LRARTIRRAMLRPDRYLATALAEWPDADLARATRADPVTMPFTAARSGGGGGMFDFHPGDEVELLAVPPGFTQLHLGQRGVVLIAPEAGERLATVRFRGRRGTGAPRPLRLEAHYLRLVQPAQPPRRPPGDV